MSFQLSLINQSIKFANFRNNSLIIDGKTMNLKKLSIFLLRKNSIKNYIKNNLKNIKIKAISLSYKYINSIKDLQLTICPSIMVDKFSKVLIKERLEKVFDFLINNFSFYKLSK
jgi:hypothetical protein